MTEKNIFVYKLFLSSNISYFSFLLIKNCNPPRKKSPPSLQATPSNHRDPVKPQSPPSPRFWKFGRRLNPSTSEEMEGESAHYDHTYFLCLIVGRSQTAHFGGKTLKIIDNFSTGAFYSHFHSPWQLGTKE